MLAPTKLELEAIDEDIIMVRGGRWLLLKRETKREESYWRGRDNVRRKCC